MTWDKAVLILYMVIISVFDIKLMKIPWTLVIVGAVLDVLLMINNWQSSVSFYIYGALPGLILLLIGYFTKVIGTGDGLVIIIAGLITGYLINVEMLMWAFLFTAIVSVIMISIKKYGNKKRIPFIPFLTAALIMVIF